MEQHIYSISLEEFKRLYPNFEFVGGELSDESQASQQQVILAPNDSIILNETPIQQLVTYQQSTQNAQTYVIQSSENDSTQQTAAVAQQSIYYSTEVPSPQTIQHQPVQQQQQHLNLSHQVHQETTQQNLILQDTIGTNQQTTSPLIQQTIPSQSATHQHVIMQQTPHLVLQQQDATQHQHQPTNQIVIRPLTVNQPRYIYQQNQTTRTLIYNTQPQATLPSNNQQQSIEHQNIQQQNMQQHNVQSQQQQKHLHTQQAESPQAHAGAMQQQSRHLIVGGQTQMQTNLMYPSPQSQYQSPHQRLHQQHQITQSSLLQKRQADSPSTPISPSRVIRTASPRVSVATQNQTPKLTPFRSNPRFQSPVQLSNQISPASAVATVTDSITPPSATKTPLKQVPRKTSNARGRGSGAPRASRGGMASRPISQSSLSLMQQQQTPPQQHQVHEAQQRQSQLRSIQNQPNAASTPKQPPQVARQSMPPLVSSPTVQQRIFNSVLNCGGSAPKPISTTGHVAQRVITTQTPSKLNSPGSSQGTLQLAQTYRTPKQNINTSTNANDLEESIQAVVVTKANERSTSTSTDSAVSKAFQTTVTTYSTIEFADDEKKTLKINGRVLPLSELKRQQQRLQQQTHQQASQAANKSLPSSRISTSVANRSANVSTGTQPPPAYQRSATGQQAQPSETSKKIVRATTQNQQIIQPISNNKLQNPSGDSQKSARMLVILGNGEQRLITFTLPRESCTVQELLEQVGVPFTPETSIQCFPNPGANIDYIVTVGITVQEPAKLATAAENSLQLSKQQQDTSPQHSSTTAEQATQSSTSDKSSADIPKEPPTKIIPGFLAVCTQCGYTGCDFAKCERCKRIFTEEPRRVTTAKVLAKSEEDKKKASSTAELLSRAAAKATLTVAAGALPHIRAGKVTLTTTLSRGRGRAVTRIKPAEIEPVILTLSSDDEGDDEKSNKSMKAPVVVPNLPIQRPPLTCEPIILDTMSAPANLEESIQAVVVTKANERSTSTSTDSAVSKAFQTTVTTYSIIEFADDEKKTLKINGRVLPLSELKRQQQRLQQQTHQQASQAANKSLPSGRISTPVANRSANVSTGTQPPPAYQRSAAGQQAQPSETSKKIVRATTQNQQIIQPISNNKLQNPSGDSQKSARMLVILGNGEQRLITFTLPRESCTVQELLEQVGVPFTSETSIHCFPNLVANIDYIVIVGINVQEPAKLATAAENSLQLSKQQQDTGPQHWI